MPHIAMAWRSTHGHAAFSGHKLSRARCESMSSSRSHHANPATMAVKLTNLLNPARNLDAILVALRSNGERERGIKNSSIQTCYGNGLGNGLGMVSKSGVSKYQAPDR